MGWKRSSKFRESLAGGTEAITVEDGLNPAIQAAAPEPRQRQRPAGRSCQTTKSPESRADPHRSPRKPSVPRVRRLAARICRNSPYHGTGTLAYSRQKGRHREDPKGLFLKKPLADASGSIDPILMDSEIFNQLLPSIEAVQQGWHHAFDRSRFRQLSRNSVRRGGASVRQSAVCDTRVIHCYSYEIWPAGCQGGAKVALPLMPGISSGASAVISPKTLTDWFTPSTRPPSLTTFPG